MAAHVLNQMIKRNLKPFDPANKQDLDSYKKFILNNAWGPTGCPFTLEDPWLSVPDMIKDKIARHFLKIA